MIKWIFRRALGRFERDWKYDASYLRDIIDDALFNRVLWLTIKGDVPYPEPRRATALELLQFIPREARDHR